MTTQNSAGPRLALIAERFESVVRAMMNTIARTGRSGVLNTARDFSCCVVTADHRLLAAAESLPIHVLSGPDLIARYVLEQHPDAAPGDAFLHNSPYHGNSHAADHCLVVPVFDAGRHRFTVLAKAHQADCGNAVATTYDVTARDVYAEGALIMPAVRVQRAGTNLEDVLRMLEMRIRVPRQWRGDYLAMLGATRIGERRLTELGRELGWELLDEFAEGWFDYAERLMEQAILGVPAGTVQAQTLHDPFPGVPDGIPLQAEICVEHEPARVTVDLRDNPDTVPCGLNLTEATSRTAAMLGVFNSLRGRVIPNAGSFRRIEVRLRENCVAGIPRHPASCSAATTDVADRIANAVQRAIAELGDGVGMAEVGLVHPPALSVISGRDPRADGQPFVNQLFLATTGGAGGPQSDGWLNMLHVGNAGGMLRDSVEMDELRYPVRVEEQRIVPDTEGAGRHRGAPGALVEFSAVGTTVEVVYNSDGSVHPAAGARGGQAGARARQYRRLRNGDLEPLPSVACVQLEAGESIVSYTCGGGGYGPALQRDPARVLRDLAEGWITVDRARDTYGVVVSPDGTLDRTTTDQLRERDIARPPSSASTKGC